MNQVRCMNKILSLDNLRDDSLHTLKAACVPQFITQLLICYYDNKLISE